MSAPDKKLTPRCKGKTHDHRWPYSSSPCYNKPWKDGYCKRHHPEEKKRKYRERYEKKFGKPLTP